MSEFQRTVVKYVKAVPRVYSEVYNRKGGFKPYLTCLHTSNCVQCARLIEIVYDQVARYFCLAFSSRSM